MFLNKEITITVLVIVHKEVGQQCEMYGNSLLNTNFSQQRNRHYIASTKKDDNAKSMAIRGPCHNAADENPAESSSATVTL